MNGLNIDYNIWDVDCYSKNISVHVYYSCTMASSVNYKIFIQKQGILFLTSSTDFHLLTGSPAIKAGANLGYTLDLDGIPITGTPEIGAYQYGGTTATAERHNVATNGSDSNPGTITQP